MSSSSLSSSIRADWVTTPTAPPLAPPATTPPTALDEKALLALLDGTDVPGLDPDDPDVRVLTEGLPTEAAQKTFTMARREGFLQIDLGYGLYPDTQVIGQLLAVWGIRCRVMAHPPIVLTVMPDGEGQLRCDLAPVEQVWTFGGFASIGRLLELKWVRPGYRWSFTETALEVGGLEAGDAVAMARGVVWLVTSGA